MLSAHLWSEAQFVNSRKEWSALVAESDADPLFMSWYWQTTWWRHHRELLDAKLQVIAIHAGSLIVAIAPLYTSQATLKGLVRVRRIQPIGIAWENDSAAFSEHLDVIVRRGWRDPVVRVLAGFLYESVDWDELTAVCMGRDACLSEVALREFSDRTDARRIDCPPSDAIDIAAGFHAFLRTLKSDARRRVFGHRTRPPRTRFSSVPEDDISSTLALLAELRQDRWRRPLSESHRAFDADIAMSMHRAGALQLTSLSTENGLLSVMFNVRAMKTEYFLQSGFVREANRGLSPGMLHLGYAIESAANAGFHRFDLLAGSGKNRDYKADFRPERTSLIGFSVARPMWLRAAYKFQQYLSETGR